MNNLLDSAAAPDESWPEIVPLDSPNPPELDASLLPRWAGSYARALAEQTETPFELVAGMILATCATAAARRMRVCVSPGHIEPCNLWVVAALPSGNRKSAVQSAAIAPLLAWEKDQAVLADSEIKRCTSERKSLEARVKELRNQAAKGSNSTKAKKLIQDAADLESDMPEVPIAPQLWTSDATPERLGSLLADQGECMAWLSSEGGIFDLLQGRYSNGIPNLDLMLKVHAGDSERVDRGSRPPVVLGSPLLTIGLSPQPDVLRSLSFKPGFRGRGLLARFLYLLPPSRLGYRTLKTAPVPADVTEDYMEGLRSMLNWNRATDEQGAPKPHYVHLSPEAFAAWEDFNHMVEKQMRPGGDMEHITDWGGKAPGAAARLAGVLHGIKYAHGRPWESIISKDTMKDAISIMAVFMRHSLCAMNLMGSDPTVAAGRNVWSWIVRNRLTSFSVRDAFNALRGTYPRVVLIRAALEALEERGYVMVIESSIEHPGRPASPTVRVRPGLIEA